jgi:hypothetical protein
MAEHLRHVSHNEGVVFIGKAQEKTSVFRTEKRRNPRTGAPYLWIVRSTAMVNHYYIYALARDFGPFFLSCRYRHDKNYSDCRIIPRLIFLSS